MLDRYQPFTSSPHDTLMIGTLVRMVPSVLSFLFFFPLVLQVCGHWAANFLISQYFFFGLPSFFLFPSSHIRSAGSSLIPNFPTESSQGQDGSQRLGQFSKTLSIWHRSKVFFLEAHSQLRKTSLLMLFLRTGNRFR